MRSNWREKHEASKPTGLQTTTVFGNQVLFQAKATAGKPERKMRAENERKWQAKRENFPSELRGLADKNPNRINQEMLQVSLYVGEHMSQCFPQCVSRCHPPASPSSSAYSSENKSRLFIVVVGELSHSDKHLLIIELEPTTKQSFYFSIVQKRQLRKQPRNSADNLALNRPQLESNLNSIHPSEFNHFLSGRNKSQALSSWSSLRGRLKDECPEQTTDSVTQISFTRRQGQKIRECHEQSYQNCEFKMSFQLLFMLLHFAIKALETIKISFK